MEKQGIRHTEGRRLGAPIVHHVTAAAIPPGHVIKRTLLLSAILVWTLMLLPSGWLGAKPLLSSPTPPAVEGSSATAFNSLPPGSAPAIAMTMLKDLPEEYQLREKGGAFAMSNPAHAMDIAFTPDGIRVTSGAREWGMAMTGIGTSGSVKPVRKPVLRNYSGRMVYEREGVAEWYINSPWGLEHGFTVEKAPDEQRRDGLVVELSITGDLQPVLDSDSLVLTDAQGNSIARYSGLQVFDADSRTLPAHLILAGRTLRILVDDVHAQYPVTIDPWIQQAKLTYPLGVMFGSSISNSEDTIVVGSHLSEYAYMFAQPASGWTGSMNNATLLHIDDATGGPVAISGDTIVVGTSFSGAGTALVYSRPVGWPGSTIIHETAILAPSDGAQYKEYGCSVAISGDTIVVGASFDAEHRGAVYVFVKPSSGWTNMTQTAKLTASDGAEYDRFGSSVSISGDTIIVGANSAVYVFAKPSSGWANMTQTAKLTAVEANYLGGSVAISGDSIVAGGNSLVDQGDAFVFVKPGEAWTNITTPTARLTASDGAEGDRFGRSVAISGGTIVVGANGDDILRGSAYVFERPKNGWTSMTETAKIAASGGEAGDQFGSSVAISGGTISVGAVYNGGTGSVYVFEPGSPVINTEQWELFSDTSQGFANLTLVKKADGTITADGNWAYTYQGAKSSGSFTRAPVTISGTVIAITASGIATSPTAPPGYTTSPYTLRISGTAYDGQGSGTFMITFQTYGWPEKISGNWQGTRTGGSGITAVKTRPLPWLMLLLKN